MSAGALAAAPRAGHAGSDATRPGDRAGSPHVLRSPQVTSASAKPTGLLVANPVPHGVVPVEDPASADRRGQGGTRVPVPCEGSMTQDQKLSDCSSNANGRCDLYRPGHNTHWIHAKHVGRTPWGWRDGVISAVDGLVLSVRYLQQDHDLRVWHHESLSGEVRVNDPVRVHEQHHALGGPFGWVNVVLRGGLGEVPEPADPSAWAAEVTGGVQDMGTGRGLALDWRSSDPG